MKLTGEQGLWQQRNPAMNVAEIFAPSLGMGNVEFCTVLEEAVNPSLEHLVTAVTQNVKLLTQKYWWKVEQNVKMAECV